MPTTRTDQVSERGVPSARDWRRWVYPLVLLALCAVLFLWRLGLTALDDFDEAYYAEGAREMLERGDLGTPYFNGQPFLLKPVLIYWLIAAASRLFGMNEFAARSVSAFFAVVIVLATYWFGSRTLGRRAGLLAGAMLALCYAWIDTGREAMIDMPLTAALSGAVFLFFLALRAPAERKRWLYLAAYPLLGLALLAKGPAATGVVLAGFGAYLLSSGQFRNALKEGQVVPGIVLVLAVAGPWYVYESLRQPEFVQTFLIQEHFGHLQGELARDEPWWGHLKNLGIGFYPWVAFLPAAVAYAFRKTPREGVLRLAAWWALAVIAAFSVAGAKLPHYLTPAYPALALLVAGWAEEWLAGRVRSAAWVTVGAGVLGVVGVVMLAAAVVAVVMPAPLRVRMVEQFGGWEPGAAPRVMLVALAAGSLGAVGAIIAQRRRAVFPVLAAGMLAAAVAHIGWFKPRIKDLQDQPRKELAIVAGEVRPRSEPLGVFYAKRNATIFYARRPIVDLGEWEPERLVSFLRAAEPRTALTDEKFVGVVREKLPNVDVWMRRGRYVLLANHSPKEIMAPDGLGARPARERGRSR